MTDWRLVQVFADTPACPLCSDKEFNVFHVIGEGCSKVLPLFPPSEEKTHE
jgi:hypothetical protein